MKDIKLFPTTPTQKLLYSSAMFYYEFGKAFYDASLNAWQTFFNINLEPVSVKKIQNSVRSTFDTSLRKNMQQEKFIAALQEYLTAYVGWSKLYRQNDLYQNLVTIYSKFDELVEMIRDRVNRTPSEILKTKGNFDLHHYFSAIKPKNKTPILVVGSIINRHYILDLLPEVSVVRNLMEQGFDVYATDWRMPKSMDQKITLDTFSHDFLENAIEKVKDVTKSSKVTLLGYCWGGIFSLIHASLHPENVRNLILHATPLDMEKDTSVIGSWTKNINVKALVETFGHIPASYINAAFVIRNPVETILKYPRYFSEPRTISEIRQFFGVEGWLYDSPPIIGDVFRQIIYDIYKQNLLAKGKMKLDNKQVLLDKITMPVLNIIGTEDDLVPPTTSKPILDMVPSTDKKTIEFPTGHVGLCISREAHEKLWPTVGEWLKKRSGNN